MSVSKFDTLPFNCYEVGHTWSPHCVPAAATVGLLCFKESLQIYSSCYLISRLATKRIPRNYKDILSFVKDVIRSSLFLSMNGYGFVTTFCLLRKIFGSFNYFSAGYIPAFFGCYAAILIEKPARRPMLALYVTNVASETIFRMLRARGLARNVKHFDLILFGVSATAILYHMKNGTGRNDMVDSAFKTIMGSEEFPKNQTTESGSISHLTKNKKSGRGRHNPNETIEVRILKFIRWWMLSFNGKLARMVMTFHKGQGHETCPHKNVSCLHYSLKGFVTRFLAGFGLQGALQIILQLRSLLQSKLALNSKLIRGIFKSCLKTGVGLSSMCLTFRLLNCFSRWLSTSTSPARDEGAGSILPGLVSTILGFYVLGPPSTLALYVFFKAAETVISDSHKSKNWKIIRWIDSISYRGGWCLLYAASTALLVHISIMEPQNLKPSYDKFLQRINGGKLELFNRQLLSVYGTGSNLLYQNFWPHFDFIYMSKHMKKLIGILKNSGKGIDAIPELAKEFLAPNYLSFQF